MKRKRQYKEILSADNFQELIFFQLKKLIMKKIKQQKRFLPDVQFGNSMSNKYAFGFEIDSDDKESTILKIYDIVFNEFISMVKPKYIVNKFQVLEKMQ